MRHPSRRRALALAGACGLGAALVPGVAAAAPAPIHVQVGDFVPPGADLQGFYPGNAVVRQGDSLTFRFKGFHTVTFGPRKALPEVIAPTGNQNAAVNDPAGVPFWWAGTPELALNPAAVAPSKSTAVTGRALVNSGLPQGRSPKFTVTFPKKGVFTVNCLLHPKMRGKVTVLGPNGTPPAPKVQKARRVAQIAAAAKAAAAGLKKAEARARPTEVVVGPGTARWSQFRFAPAQRTVPAGSVVTFRWAGRNEIHTVSFGPRPFLESAAESLFGMTLGPLAAFPSEPPGRGPVAHAPALHGNGFLNSGILNDPGVGPPPHRFRVRFTTPGSYEYFCLVHGEDMRGTITVT